VAGAAVAGAGTAGAVAAGAGERALTDELHGRLAGIDVPSGPRGTKHTTIKHIPPGRFAITLLDMMIETNPDNAQHAIDEWLRRHAGRPASGPLQALWRSAGGSLERFRAGIEEWFDDEMQRLSDLYRRQTRWVLAILAPVVAIGLSVDSVELGRSLWTNGDLRVSLAAAASRDDQELDRIYETCRAGPSMANPTEELERVRDCVSEHLGQLNALNLTEHAVFVDPGGWRDRVASGHLLGMLGTAIAIWFGAPFWYDVLRRLTGVRARGR
jgi:hypothetical protein